jgi:periplasmic protein CpxP/Spy
MNKLGKVKTLAIGVLSAVALATPIVLAQNAGTDQAKQPGQHAEWRGEHGERGDRRGDHFGGGMFKGIELSDAQKTQMKQLHESFAERTKGLREQLRAKHEELRQAEAGGTFNEALATQKLTEAASLQAKLMGEEFKLRQDTLSILTPEQKTQLEQRRAQFKANHGEQHMRHQQQ